MSEMHQSQAGIEDVLENGTGSAVSPASPAQQPDERPQPSGRSPSPSPLLPEPDRAKFLGASDAAAVMGLSPWRTPVQLWMKKTGRAKPEKVDPLRQKMFDRGHKLEPFIRDMTIDRLREMGLEVELLACNERYVDREHKFLSCEIDFELKLTGAMTINGAEVIFDGEHVNADAKSVTGFARKKWGEEGSEDVPIEYAAQFMAGLDWTQRRFCLVAALRSFDDVDIYWTIRDDETIAAMRAKLVDFWVNHVLADVPPDPFVYSDILALFPNDNGLAIEADEVVAEKVRELDGVRKQISLLKTREEGLEKEVADFISPHARLTYEGADIATWKGQNWSGLDQKGLKEARPEVYAEFFRSKVIRVLRCVQPKKGKR